MLTRDLATIPDYAYERIAKNLSMPGVFAHHKDAPQAKVFEDLSIIIEGSLPEEWENQVRQLPF